MDQDEAAKIAHLTQELHELQRQSYGLNSIPVHRVSELNALADEFGLKYFRSAIHDQFSSVHQLSKSLARISRAIDRQYKSLDARFDVEPDYGSGWYDTHLRTITALLNEADALIVRYDNDVARVRSAYLRARADKAKGLWVPDLSAIVEDS
ncbi:hypothetical protein AMS68_001134 [Peltaster fructicola]|uniref:Uncharacterized protein n=1 Tax=Peltaster fructicola TaxID=286661 RepID=A0A6H0XLI6_9PEZI|nr:hypothetical protein AMS68_001134 [Peltaster fructicola]